MYRQAAPLKDSLRSTPIVVSFDDVIYDITDDHSSGYVNTIYALTKFLQYHCVPNPSHIISQIFFMIGSISSNLNLNTTSMICLQEILQLTIADNFQNVELKTKKLHIVLESIHWRTSSNAEVLTDKYAQLINLSYLTYNPIFTIKMSCLTATDPIFLTSSNARSSVAAFCSRRQQKSLSFST